MLHRAALPNGLTLLYREDRSLPLAAGTIFIRGGASLERPAEAGLCNLTGELLFQGSHKRKALQVASDIEALGTFMGCQVTDDYTELGFITPALNIRKTLEILLEALTQPAFARAELEKERAQVLASLSTRYDTIFNVAHDRFMDALYGGHPYGRLVEGTPATLRRFDRSAVSAWNETHFQPAHTVVSIVGPLPWRQAEKMLSQFWSRWKRKQSPTPIPGAQAPTVRKAQRLDIDSKFEQAYVMTGTLAPAVSAPDFMALKVLNTVMGGGMSSRLFLALREERGLAYEVSSFFPTRLQPSHWVVYLGCSPEQRKVAEEQLEIQLEKVATKGISAAEMAQAKQMMKASFVMDHQTRRRQAWYAGWWEFLGFDPSHDGRFIERVDAVGLADVKRVASRWFNQPRITVRVFPR